MTKSGLADNPLFSRSPIVEATPSPVTAVIYEKPNPKPVKKNNLVRSNKPKSTLNTKTSDTVIPSNHATVVSRHHDTMASSNHDTMIETVRKAVKEMGKEAATHRFTIEEKKAVLDLIYSYKSSGVKTSENEVARIAINFILEDYKQNGQNSILDRVLKALNE